jgi:hypothetical protein
MLLPRGEGAWSGSDVEHSGCCAAAAHVGTEAQPAERLGARGQSI